jgi:hypothetical protein
LKSIKIKIKIKTKITIQIKILLIIEKKIYEYTNFIFFNLILIFKQQKLIFIIQIFLYKKITFFYTQIYG